MPGAVTLIRFASLSGAAGYAYAAAGARLIVSAGACPLNADGPAAVPGDCAGQAAKAAENTRTTLADAGAAVDDALRARALAASSRRQDLAAARKVVRDSSGEHDVPATLTGGTVPGCPGQLAETGAIAAVPDQAGSADGR